MISRRHFVATAGLLILIVRAASRPAKVWRIGYLRVGLAGRHAATTSIC